MDPELLKQTYAGVFNRSAPAYGQVGPAYFAHFGRRLVEFAGIPAGARVLDIASGRGAVLFPAAEAAGPSGEVTGVDLSAVMVDETRREIDRRAIPNARVMQMDAEDLHFPDARFDCVLCGFALFFFPRLDQALAEIHRVLVSGGQVAVSTWSANRDPRWEWLGPLVKSYLPPKPQEVGEKQPAPDFGTQAGLEAILASGGFDSLRAGIETAEFAFRSENEWWSTTWSHGGRHELEAIEKSAGAEGLERLKAEAFAHLRAFKTDGRIPMTLEVVFAVGKK